MRAQLAQSELDPLESAREVLRRTFGHAEFRGRQAHVKTSEMFACADVKAGRAVAYNAGGVPSTRGHQRSM